MPMVFWVVFPRFSMLTPGEATDASERTSSHAAGLAGSMETMRLETKGWNRVPHLEFGGGALWCIHRYNVFVFLNFWGPQLINRANTKPGDLAYGILQHGQPRAINHPSNQLLGGCNEHRGNVSQFAHWFRGTNHLAKIFWNEHNRDTISEVSQA